MSFLCCHTQTEYSYHVVMFCPHKQHEKGHPQMTSQILSLWHINLAFCCLCNGNKLSSPSSHQHHFCSTLPLFFSLSIAEVCNALHTTQTEADKERTQMFSSNPMWDTTTAATTTATHFNAPQPLFSAKRRTQWRAAGNRIDLNSFECVLQKRGVFFPFLHWKKHSRKYVVIFETWICRKIFF